MVGLPKSTSRVPLSAPRQRIRGVDRFLSPHLLSARGGGGGGVGGGPSPGGEESVDARVGSRISCRGSARTLRRGPEACRLLGRVWQAEGPGRGGRAGVVREGRGSVPGTGVPGVGAA